MYRKTWFGLLVFIFLCITAQRNPSNVENANGVQMAGSKFATKTTYKERILDNNSLSWKISNIPDYLIPVSIDATLRHGTRFPSNQLVNAWKELVPEIQRSVVTSDHFSPAVKNAVQSWKDRFPENSDFRLSLTGWNEHVSLGFKYYSMMEELWQKVFIGNGLSDNDDFLVLSSNKRRCLDSAKAFLSALELNVVYGYTDSPDVDHPVLLDEERKFRESTRTNGLTKTVEQYGKVSVVVNNTLLRFVDHCPKYVQSVKKNETAAYEFENFLKSKEIGKVLERFVDATIDGNSFYDIYHLCAFEKAIFHDSIWCKLFRESDLRVLEYASDLKHYYINGHGYDINVQQACHLLTHIINRLSSRPKGHYRATLRFGHAETLIPLVSLLDFYKEDGALSSSNYEQKIDRDFRTGKISPYSGNLAIVVYESKSNPHKHFVSFAINERLVKPFGQDCYFCEFGQGSIVYKKILEKVEGCDSVCALDPSVKEEL